MWFASARILGADDEFDITNIGEDDIQQFLTDLIPYAIKLLVVAIGLWLVLRAARRVVVKVPDKLRPQAEYVLPKLIKWVAFLVLLMLFGVNLNSVFAIFATIGFGATLIFTPVGQNLIAGFLAGLDDVIREGDVITVGDQIGRVVRRGALSIGVELPDGSLVYMPNVKTVDNELINHNRVRGDRIAVKVLIDEPSKRTEAVAVMQAAVEAIDWRMDDLPADVIFSEVGGDALVFECAVWIEDRFYERERKSELLTAVVDALDAAEISLGDTASIEFRGPLQVSSGRQSEHPSSDATPSERQSRVTEE